MDTFLDTQTALAFVCICYVGEKQRDKLKTLSNATDFINKAR